MDLDTKQISDIRAIVDETERRINHVDEIAEGLNIPSVNELRYTLNHLLRYLTQHDKEDATKALRHSKRALYDCYEAEVLFFHEKFALFENDYRLVPLGNIVPEIHDWRIHFETLQDFVRTTPRNDRDEYYERLKDLHVHTHIIVRKLKSARQEINNYLAQEREKKEREIRILKWTIVGAVGVLATLAFVVIVELRKYSEIDTQNTNTQISIPKPTGTPNSKP